MTILEKVSKVVEAETGETVSLETRLRTLVTDSLEMANLILELEGTLHIEIPDEEAQKLYTIHDVVAYAEAH